MKLQIIAIIKIVSKVISMKKAIFKKILCSIHTISLQVQHDELLIALQQELSEDEIVIKEEDLKNIVLYVQRVGILYKDQVGYDISPCGYVFAKANNGSIAEGLAFFECILKMDKIAQSVEGFILKKKFMDISTCLDPTSFDFLSQTVLWDKEQHCLHSIFISDLTHILQEYHQRPLILSSTLSAVYANELIDHKDDSLKYRNQDSLIVEYKNIKTILEIIPKKGIPENRDVTRSTQSFYKDTLLHEFHHTCPICGIDIPHMLIASHIKPFRDCAHIYETLDHHNGLLLCRNHDYLFDQGFFSFDDNGAILLSAMLLQKPSLDAYGIHKQTQLSKEYMQDERKLFLQYHRCHIFQS